MVANSVVVDFPIYGGKSRSLKNTFLHAATGGRLARDAGERVVVRALNGLSFEFNEGDRVGIVGHNGSGKSTLLRAANRLNEVTRGQVLIKDSKGIGVGWIAAAAWDFTVLNSSEFVVLDPEIGLEYFRRRCEPEQCRVSRC